MKPDAFTIQTEVSVLVVEDEVLIAMDIEQTLVGIGCNVLGPALSVSEALMLIEQEEPGFALLDVNLGRERSTPVAEALRARGVPFALATAYNAAQLPEPAFHGVPSVGKPLNLRLLRSLLAELG